jgi:phosphoribosylformylglycinamidine cyclo-ligase
MDYIGLGKMDEEVVYNLVKGVAAGCKENGCALLGGETAEMPGFYSKGEYDIAGFVAGISENVLPDKNALRAGDLIVGFSSNGLHTNGYSLARKAFFEMGKMGIDDTIPETGTKVGDELLKVHHSYLKTIYPLVKRRLIKAAAHITGGGFEGGVFKAIMRLAEVGLDEMYRVFNMGIGFVAVVGQEQRPRLRKYLDAGDCEVVPIGTLKEGTGKVILRHE